MEFRPSEADKGISRVWRCLNTRCPKYRKDVSARKGTWFSHSKMSIEKILLITYCFAKNVSNKTAMEETSIEDATSSETISDWYTDCMDLCCDIVYNHSEPIGGPGCTVEIDEGKFGKRKYNRGRLVDGQWILGGYCRETKKCFFVPVPKRDRETLLPIIIQNVLPGSTIITDCWKAYNTLNEHDYIHLTVNHSLNFVDPVTYANTQSIESQWWQIKRKLPETHTRHERLIYYLAHYIFNKLAAESNQHIFIYFLNQISQFRWIYLVLNIFIL